MKKSLVIIAALALTLSFSACGAGSGSTKSAENTSAEQMTAYNQADQQTASSAPSEEEFVILMDFETTDIDGQAVSSADYFSEENKLVLFNLWEPWCGPCVQEMPELEQLYQNYKDQGFLIVGVFATADMTEDAKAIVEEKGVTYPVIHMEEFLSMFQTEYVPTSFFVDGDGKLLSRQAIIGANSYDSWESMVKEYLE